MSCHIVRFPTLLNYVPRDVRLLFTLGAECDMDGSGSNYFTLSFDAIQNALLHVILEQAYVALRETSNPSVGGDA